MITWWRKLGENLPPGYNALLFWISGTGSFICLLYYTAGHTKAFDCQCLHHPSGIYTEVWSSTMTFETWRLGVFYSEDLAPYWVTLDKSLHTPCGNLSSLYCDVVSGALRCLGECTFSTKNYYNMMFRMGCIYIETVTLTGTGLETG